ncbi:MAG: 16S rRNA (adenine(1518)-N(6)/adenine(1519)-N(6))-dimethyltransferase RsmA [Rickettsiales bacterium]|jgi:16S rRNA (adenine1518-N6/adenine1519-N6)-dimethyltransferase|nr:16S rRNA (adenine(1518)-N(6)/adenine(1519)-N(6))-dimethyltransferase RsmA [Rickettsiales bacterium]
MDRYNVSDILRKYDLVIKKKYGQNFLTDRSILDKIVDVAGDIENKNILEIGAGPGGLTNSILQKKPKQLVSVEIDTDYFYILQKEFGNCSNFKVINQDALKIDENSISDRINVIANLPYNVGTHLLFKWFENIEIFESFTLLLQKEVVDRITAKQNTKEYGVLSVLAQTFTTPKKMFDIKPTSFIPPPKVMSSVVFLKPKKTDANFKNLSKIAKMLFANRRKKIRKVIENLRLQNSDLNLDNRAEELTVEDFINLSKLF